MDPAVVDMGLPLRSLY